MTRASALSRAGGNPSDAIKTSIAQALRRAGAEQPRLITVIARAVGNSSRRDIERTIHLLIDVLDLMDLRSLDLEPETDRCSALEDITPEHARVLLGNHWSGDPSDEEHSPDREQEYSGPPGRMRPCVLAEPEQQLDAPRPEVFRHALLTTPAGRWLLVFCRLPGDLFEDSARAHAFGP